MTVFFFSPGIPKQQAQTGLTLVELLVALALTAILMLALVRYATAAGASQRLQDNQALFQDQARVVYRMLSTAIGEAGFSPTPWNPSTDARDPFAGSIDGVTSRSDRLVIRALSDRNCFENLNPETGADGRPAFFLREQSWDLNDDAQLTRTCRYGPDESTLVTQVRRQGRVPGVEAFRFRFAADGDGDGDADRWVAAGGWSDPGQVLGVRVGLLLRGADAVVEPVAGAHDVLGVTFESPADGRLRSVFEFTVAVRGRTG